MCFTCEPNMDSVTKRLLLALTIVLFVTSVCISGQYPNRLKVECEEQRCADACREKDRIAYKGGRCNSMKMCICQCYFRYFIRCYFPKKTNNGLS